MPQHMKAIATPRTWPMNRKEMMWVTVPQGAHKLEYALSVNAVFKDLLKIAKTTKEVRYILFNTSVLINGKKVMSEKTQVGLFDVLTLPETKQNFTILLNSQQRLEVKELSAEEAKTKIAKVIAKTYLPKKKVQLNLFGGLNIIVDKDVYAVGDTVVLTLPDRKISDHIKLEKDVLVYLLTGQHTAAVATVSSIDDTVITCKTEGEEFAVQKRQIFIVGKKKPLLQL